MKAIDLAEYVIWYAEIHKYQITNLRLQKILFFLEGYSWRYFSRSAFEEDIEWWQYGPLIPIVYFYFNNHTREPLCYHVTAPLFPSKDIRSLYDIVIQRCFQLSIRDLVDMTVSKKEPLTYRAKYRPGSLDLLVVSRQDIQSYFANENPLNLKE